jgi:hypothetical protein
MFLLTEGCSVPVESRRQADHGQAGQSPGDDDLHPAIIGIHGFPGRFPRPVILGIEGKHLGAGEPNPKIFLTGLPQDLIQYSPDPVHHRHNQGGLFRNQADMVMERRHHNS